VEASPTSRAEAIGHATGTAAAAQGFVDPVQYTGYLAADLVI
jgi:hypothetical protein